MDSSATSEQQTWIIPAVRGTKVPQHAAGYATGDSYVSLIRNLVKNSSLYALASLVSPLVTLVLTPFLTHHLSHSDYGAFAILTTIVTLIAGVTQCGLGSAFYRAYCYDYESRRDRLAVVSTVTILLLLISVLTAIVGIIAAPWLAVLLLKSSAFSDPVKVAALVILVQNLTVPGFSWLRVENRAALSSTLSIANLLVTLGANVVLVGVMRMGISGSLMATGSGYAIVAVCTLPIILLRTRLRLRLDIARGVLTFGLPQVINLLSGWVLQLSDRYLLGHLGSLSQVASYAVAYSLGSALSTLIIAPFSLAWWTIMFPIAKRKDALHIFQLVFRWYSLILLFATLGLSFFGVNVLDHFFPSAYHSAAPIIPIIATSIMFSGIFIVVAVGTSLQRKVWFVAAFITCSAILNVGLNMVLIPLYGSMGAAVATLIAYITLALITYYANQRIYPVPFEIGRFIIALLVGIALYTGSYFLAPAQYMDITWAVRIGLLILYGGSLLWLGKLPARKKLQTSTSN